MLVEMRPLAVVGASAAGTAPTGMRLLSVEGARAAGTAPPRIRLLPALGTAAAGAGNRGDAQVAGRGCGRGRRRRDAAAGAGVNAAAVGAAGAGVNPAAVGAAGAGVNPAAVAGSVREAGQRDARRVAQRFGLGRLLDARHLERIGDPTLHRLRSLADARTDVARAPHRRLVARLLDADQRGRADRRDLLARRRHRANRHRRRGGGWARGRRGHRTCGGGRVHGGTATHRRGRTRPRRHRGRRAWPGRAHVGAFRDPGHDRERDWRPLHVDQALVNLRALVVHLADRDFQHRTAHGVRVGVGRRRLGVDHAAVAANRDRAVAQQDGEPRLGPDRQVPRCRQHQRALGSKPRELLDELVDGRAARGDVDQRAARGRDPGRGIFRLPRLGLLM